MTFRKQSILVMDDDGSVRAAVRTVLEGAGYNVVTAADAEEAAVRFVPEEIDLVILDLNLPLRSGWDAFEQLTTQYPTTPVIIMTGMPDQYRTAQAVGVGALIEKPIEVPALLKTMKELLAEPCEARLRRLCGYQQDTRYLPPRAAVAPEKWHAPAASPRRRHEIERGSQ